ncbi:MAG: TIGR00725 family protein [Thermodesulfobacteriota bacterium]|nr:TIGR00725 family protein [Thermodesulfobacteriota bacterium]
MAFVKLCDNPFQIGVFGSGTADEKSYRLAYEVGAAVAREGHIVVNGGLSGVMEASGRGAAEAGGLVVGVLPGDQFSDSNPYCTVKIVTGMHYARNYINGLSCHGAIVVGGSSGAYEEARRVWEGRGPVVVLAGGGSATGAGATMISRQETLGIAFPEDKDKPYRIFVAGSPEESVSMVIDLINRKYPQHELENKG